MKRFALMVTLVAAIAALPKTVDAQWKYGWSTEAFVPLGDLAEISLIGLSGEVYAGRLINRSQWAVEFDVGIHWFIPEELTTEEVPDWVVDYEPNSNGLVKLSGSFIPVRASITRFVGRYYFSPRVGMYFPIGDFRKDVGLSPTLGFAPRLGYFFPMSSEVQFDLAIEYNYLFGDPSFQYVGLSMGVFFGGRRLSRR